MGAKKKRTSKNIYEGAKKKRGKRGKITSLV
jgi:hypothetical protein